MRWTTTGCVVENSVPAPALGGDYLTRERHHGYSQVDVCPSLLLPGGFTLKIMFALLLVFVALVAMIFAFAWMDGEFGDAPGGLDANASGPMTGIEKTYIEYTIGHLESASTDINSLGYLFSAAEFDNEEWRMAVAVVLNRIQSAFARVAELEPPARLQEFHDVSVNTLGHAARFADLVNKILKSGNAQLDDESATELVALSNGFQEAERLLNEFVQAHPVPVTDSASVAEAAAS